MRTRQSSHLLVGAVVAVWMAAPALAQQDGDAVRAEEPGVATARNPANVHLDTSFEAAQKLAKAQRLVEAGRWLDAAGLLDEACAADGDKLVEVSPGYFETVTETVRKMVSAWPANGVVSYRRVVDPLGADVLAKGVQDHSIGTLLEGFNRFFASSHGYELGDSVGQLAIEDGEFELARRVYQLLLDEHPDKERLADELRAKLALVCTLAGDRAKADAYLAAGRASEVELQWLGERRPAREIVEQLRSTFAPVEAGGVDDWPTFAGGRQRDGVADVSLGELAALWRFNEFGPESPTPIVHKADLFGRDKGPGQVLGLFPAYGEGRVFVQDSVQAWAIDAETGALLWRYECPTVARLATHASDMSVAPWYGPTYESGRLYACFGGGLMPNDSMAAEQSISAIVCLDAVTGREIWRREGDEAGVRFARVEFDGAPLVVGGTVLAVERRHRAFGFEGCFLDRLDASTGRLLSRTHLGSASTGGFGFRQATMCIPASRGGIAYLCTNLGTIAAIESHTGAVCWLRTYAQDADHTRISMQEGGSAWRYNATIVAGDRLVCLPTDVDRLIVLNRHTGGTEREIDCEELGNAESIIGVVDDRVYGVGERVFAFDLRDMKVAWFSDLPTGDELYGRGLLTKDAVLIPTVACLCTFDRSTGSRRDEPWPGPKAGGNLCPAGTRLVAVGADHVTAYEDRDELWRRLREQLKANSWDPRPAFDLAEVAYRSGEPDTAVEALKEAVERSTSIGAAGDPALRSRVFSDALRFAGGLNEHGQQIELYELAGRWASRPADQPAYRLPLAALYESAGRASDAVDLYQGLLSDAAVRTLPAEAGDVQPNATVGDVAAARIAELIAARGRDVYRRQDEAATARVKEAQARGDVPILRDLCAMFPNSTAAGQGRVAIGDLLRRRRRFIEAARTYQRAYVEQKSSGTGLSPGDLLARIVECYSAAGRSDTAAQWVALADARLNESQARLVKSAASSPASLCTELPAFSLPLSKRYERPLAQGDLLLGLPATTAPTSNRSLYFIYGADGLTAFHAATNEPAWKQPARCRTKPEILSVDTQRVVVATLYEICALDVRSGDRMWTVGTYPEAADSPNADHEDFAHWRYHVVDCRNVVGFRDSGEVVSIDIATGEQAWSRKLATAPSGPPAIGDGYVAFPAPADEGGRCVVLDRQSGESLGAFQLDVPIERVFVRTDDIVMAVTSRGLYAYSPPERRMVWTHVESQPVQTYSVIVGLDGIYVSPDGRRVAKLRLFDGRPIWISEPTADRSVGAMRLELADDELLAVRPDGCTVLNATTGEFVQQKELHETPYFDEWFVARHRTVGLRGQNRDLQMPRRLYVYGRGPSGDGDAETRDLGFFDHLEQAVLCDGAFVLQEGRTIVSWPAGQ